MSGLGKGVRGDGIYTHYFKVGDKLVCTRGNRQFTEEEVYTVKHIYDGELNNCVLEVNNNVWTVTKQRNGIIADFGCLNDNAHFELVKLTAEGDMKDSLMINNQKVRLLGITNGLDIYETLEDRDKVVYINQNDKLLLRINISCDKNSDKVDVNFS